MDARSISRQIGGKRWRKERPSGMVGELLVPLAPSRRRNSIYLPLLVLVAVLPGLYAVTQSWDLDPPAAWWGLRGLAVADGRWWDQYQPIHSIVDPQAQKTYRRAALEPPLFAWLEGASFSISRAHDPVLAVLPSWIAGCALVLLVYALAKTYYDSSTAFLASGLAASSHAILAQEKLASPATLEAALAVAVLLALESWRQGERGLASKAAAAGALLGMSFLAGGWFALVALPQWLLGELLNRPADEPEASGRAKPAWRPRSGAWILCASALAALALASIWFFSMHRVHGREFMDAMAAPLDANPVLGEEDSSLLHKLVKLAPILAPLALLSAGALAVGLLKGEEEPTSRDKNRGGGLLSWLVVASLLPAVWRGAPKSVTNIYIIIPICILAARAIVDFSARRFPVRLLVVLGPATALSYSWAKSSDLRGAILRLSSGKVDYATALGLHLALDLLVCSIVFCHVLDRWARRRDSRRRGILAVYLALSLLAVFGDGARDIQFRRRETRELLELRRIILRRDQARPFSQVVVVERSSAVAAPGSAPRQPIDPGGRLRFILQAALPKTQRVDMDDFQRLEPNRDQQTRLVLLMGKGDQSAYERLFRLNLETIHPGVAGVFEAFATIQDASTRSQVKQNLKAYPNEINGE